MVHPVPDGRQRSGERGQSRHPLRHRHLPLLGVAHAAARQALRRALPPGPGRDARPDRGDARRLCPRHGRTPAGRRDQHGRLGPAATPQPRRGRAARVRRHQRLRPARHGPAAAGLRSRSRRAAGSGPVRHRGPLRRPDPRARPHGGHRGVDARHAVGPHSAQRHVDEPDRVRRGAGHDAPARHCLRVRAVALPVAVPRHAGGDDRLDLLLDVALRLPLLAGGHDRPRAVVGRAPSATRPRLPRRGQRGDVRDGPRPAGLDPRLVLQRRRGPEHRLADRQLRHRRGVHLQLALGRQGLRDVPPEVLDPRQRLPRHDDRDRPPGTCGAPHADRGGPRQCSAGPQDPPGGAGRRTGGRVRRRARGAHPVRAGSARIGRSRRVRPGLLRRVRLPQTAGCFFLFIGLAGAMRRITRASAPATAGGAAGHRDEPSRA